MTKIFIDTSFDLEKKTGIGVYILTLMDCLTKLNYEYKEICFKLDKKIKFQFWIYMLWLNTVFYIKTLIEKPDIIIYPGFRMPWLKRKGTKYITVIYDLCAYRKDEMPKYMETVFKFATEISTRRADVIVTDSQTVKEELIHKFKINPERIVVVYNAVADYFRDFSDNPEVLDKYKIEKQKYILSVATLNKRKNIPELIKAFDSISDKYPDLKLVLVGKMGNEQKESLTKNPNIIFTGYIPDEDIPVLYKNALMYVFPSLYEGFGSPVMEAQYSKTPLICSDIPVFREVAGDGAEFCSTDYKGIAEKIEHLLNNPDRRKELIALGFENSDKFLFDNVVNQFEEALNKRSIHE